MNEFHIVMKFGAGYSLDDQAAIMLRLEKDLRERGWKAEVLKETKPDDLKRRREMTVIEREKL